MNTNAVRFFAENPTPENSDGKELIIATWRLANAENMGKIIRLGYNVGAKKVLFINRDEAHRMSKIKKTAGFSFDQMDWEIISPEEFESGYLCEYPVAALETCDGASDIYATKIAAKTILLAGSESHGISEEVLQKCAQKVFIPMPGGCKSMNISNALSVAAFEWYRQQNY